MMPKLITPHGSWKASYFGTQKLEDFPSDIAYAITSAPQYIDLTSGGGGMAYVQAITGQPVVANDRCYYASLCTKVVLAYDPGFGALDVPALTWIEDFAAWIDPDELHWIAVDSFLAAKDRGKGPKLSDDVLAYLDLLLGLESDLVRGLIGTWLVTHCTYRGTGWAAKTAKSGSTLDYTPDDVSQGIIRTAWRWRHFADKVPEGTDTQVYNLDALDALHAMDIEPGAVVFANPQFPWAKTQGPTPFKFFTDKLDPLLSPEPLPTWREWPKNMDVIGEDVARWMEAAFSRGVAKFIFAAQDTNAPPPRRRSIIFRTWGFVQRRLIVN
jgi:hypothetical protein